MINVGESDHLNHTAFSEFAADPIDELPMSNE